MMFALAVGSTAILMQLSISPEFRYWPAPYTSWLAWRALMKRGYSRHASSLSIGTENSQSTSITHYRRVISVVVPAYGPSNGRRQECGYLIAYFRATPAGSNIVEARVFVSDQQCDLGD